MVHDTLEESALAASTLMILKADHGGTGLLHPPEDPRGQHIPWIATGPSVRKNVDLARVPGLAITTMATFATVCAALDIATSVAPDAKPVMEILDSGAARWTSAGRQ